MFITNNFKKLSSTNSNQEFKHHSPSSSLVFSAKNIFSASKITRNSTSSTDKNQTELDDKHDKTSGISNGLITASNFFRRHKSSKSIIGQELKFKNQKFSNNNVTNSFFYLFFQNNIYILFFALKFANVAKNYDNNEENAFVGFDSNRFNNNYSDNNASELPFNLCPKLDHTPVIEPLICKRISNERLTSIVFKSDCFIVANQGGLISTWSRPLNNDLLKINSSSSNSSTNQRNVILKCKLLKLYKF